MARRVFFGPLVEEATNPVWLVSEWPQNKGIRRHVVCKDSKHFLREPAKAPWLRVRLTVLSVAAEHSRTVPAFTRSLWREQPAGCCLQNGTGLLFYFPKIVAGNLGLPASGYYYGVFTTTDYGHLPDSITLLVSGEKKRIEFGSGLTGVTARIVLTPRMASWVRKLNDSWIFMSESKKSFVSAMAKYGQIQLPSFHMPDWMKVLDGLFKPAWVVSLFCYLVMGIVFAATTALAR